MRTLDQVVSQTSQRKLSLTLRSLIPLKHDTDDDAKHCTTPVSAVLDGANFEMKGGDSGKMDEEIAANGPSFQSRSVLLTCT